MTTKKYFARVESEISFMVDTASVTVGGQNTVRRQGKAGSLAKYFSGAFRMDKGTVKTQ